MSRLASGGALIDRGRTLRFRFDGVELEGFAGDTVASALIANGVDVVGRSVRLGRPRGVVAAGREEPNAYVQIGAEPMVRATDVALADGLVVSSLSGRGRLAPGRDRVRRDHVWRHCDVLVVGGGPAGLAAAAAAAPGADVVLVDGGARLGGSLLDGEDELVDGLPASEWVERTRAALVDAGATVMKRTDALGLFDDGLLVAVERDAGAARERLWHLRAAKVVVATGALERPIAFAGNDRPGVMLAGAARAYVRRWAVAPGRRALVFTTNDSAYAAAAALAGAGIEVAAVVDARGAAGRSAREAADRNGIEVIHGNAVVATHGGERLTDVEVAPLGGGPVRTIEADTLAVSGGWSPQAELPCHVGWTLAYEPSAAAFVPPRGTFDGVRCAGAAAGLAELGDCLADGWDAGVAAGGVHGGGGSPPTSDASASEPPLAFWLVPPVTGGYDAHFVDLHRDVTVADVQRATAAGLRSPEHVKRHTTLGTGPDQGRLSGTLALGVLAELLGVPIESLTPTTARPPAGAASFALLAGRARGALADPARVTPMHAAHVAAGAVFENVGQWKRPWYYPRPHEDVDAATRRECEAVRTAVGMMDASTLGKIDVHGPDATELLDRIYTGAFDALADGMAKYSIMCGTDGMVFDDGVVMRLARDRYLVTTTTGNAAAVYEWLEEWLQTEWPDLRVHCTSVTEQWATVVVAGPAARPVVAAVAPGIEVDAESFPAMAIREGMVAGVPARLCRVSFSGELAYELHVSSLHGAAVWDAVAAAGAPYGIAPYGTEALHVLRAEKGYFIVGQDTDGTVTPMDLGYGWAVSRRKPDFVGRRSHRRPDLVRDDRPQLVALLVDDAATRVVEGARVRPGGAAAADGHVTSSYASVELGRPFALGLVAGARDRLGERVEISHDGGWVSATLQAPVLVDPEGARRDG